VEILLALVSWMSIIGIVLLLPISFPLVVFCWADVVVRGRSFLALPLLSLRRVGIAILLIVPVIVAIVKIWLFQPDQYPPEAFRVVILITMHPGWSLLPILGAFAGAILSPLAIEHRGEPRTPLFVALITVALIIYLAIVISCGLVVPALELSSNQYEYVLTLNAVMSFVFLLAVTVFRRARMRTIAVLSGAALIASLVIATLWIAYPLPVD
jgi:hypothetical protein